MPQPSNLCVLIAEIVGGDRLVSRLGEAETVRAIERCLNRVDLAVGGSGGEIIARDHSAVIASFEQADSAVIAACEMLDRVLKLPPVSGTRMQVRIGIHFGLVLNGRGEGVEDARQLLLTCTAGQALASAPAVNALTLGARHFASAEAFHDPAQSHLPWPVFMIGPRDPATASAAPANASAPASSTAPQLAAQHPLPPNPASPLTSSRIPAVPESGVSFTPRLRLRHQKDIMFVEENRPVILIGRELGNDIVIIDPRASRQHARVERRRDGFVLIDQSTNGCFVAINDESEHCIKAEEITLGGTGTIGCGFSSKEFEDDTVYFDFV
ncbi:MAG: FHA domain-containing protein [Azoarcus sp.]|jgi:hypothetical protein|nr:FHA domain-containing protein [Azoarcus sp.]